MSKLKHNLKSSLILGTLIGSLVLSAPLTGNSQPAASVNVTQTTLCPDKFITSVSPSSGDASTPQIVDIVVSNGTYFDSNGGEVFFLVVDAFAVDSADPGNVIHAFNFRQVLLPGPVAGYNPMLFKAWFDFGAANACKTFNFYVITKSFCTTEFGQTEPGGSFILDCPFAALTAKVKIDKGPRRNDDKFDLAGTFILARASNGIDPLTDDLTLQLGTFSTTIPAGSFLQAPNGRLRFVGVIGGVSLDVEIHPLRSGGFDLKVNAGGVDLNEIDNPMPVKLTIGSDVGSTTVTAKVN